MRMRHLLVTVISLLSWIGQAHAHPHIFIEAGLDFIFDDQNQLTAVRVSWTYDDLYSLLVIQDLGLDNDYDGRLTPREQEKLTGFDMRWVEGFEGDLYVLKDGPPITLGGPRDYTAKLIDGRVVTTHVRDLDTQIAVGDEPLIFQIYDPGFYTAYEITGPNRIQGGAACSTQVFVPDIDEANQVLLDALKELGADVSADEAGFPAVGANFAEEVRLTCASQ